MPLFSIAQSSSEGKCDKVLKLVTHLPTPASCKSIVSRNRKQACLVEELEAYIHASLTFPTSYRSRVKSLRRTSCPLQVVIGTGGKVQAVKPLKKCPAFMATGVQVALRDMPAMEPGKLNGTARCVGVDVEVDAGRAVFSDDVLGDFSRDAMSADEIMPTRDDGPIYKVVEEMPRFYSYSCETLPRDERKACADEAMVALLAEKLEYPEPALEQGVEGSAVVSFIIEKDGRLTSIRCLRNPGAGTGEEAVRLVNEHLQGRFLPGKYQGKPARVLYNVPVKFRLLDEEAEEPLSLGSNLREIFKVVEEMPRLYNAACENKSKSQRKKCANKAMRERIYNNMVYPQEAIDAGVTDVAVVQFVVLPDGQVTDVNVVRDPGYGMGEEAGRLVREYLSAGWVPGKQRGRPVAVQFNLPVKFER